MLLFQSASVKTLAFSPHVVINLSMSANDQKYSRPVLQFHLPLITHRATFDLATMSPLPVITPRAEFDKLPDGIVNRSSLFDSDGKGQVSPPTRQTHTGVSTEFSTVYQIGGYQDRPESQVRRRQLHRFRHRTNLRV